MKTKLTIIVLISAVLVSCASRRTSTFHTPTVKAPVVFRGADPATAGDVTSIGDLKWFEVFKDEELQNLIRAALENNYDLRSAMVRVEAARANVGITRSNEFPTIGANTNVTTLRNSSSGSFPIPSGFDRNRSFGNVALNLLSFEADIWGRLRHATEAARADLLAVDENRKAVTTTLVSDVATAYFALLELDTELEIAQRTLATRQDSLQLIKKREQSGLATRLEVRQGEQLVQSAEQAIPIIEQSIEQTENQISLLLGESPRPIVRGRTLADQEQPPSVPAGLPSALLERRPDIRSAEQSLAAANASVSVAKASYFPQISLTGLLGFQSGQLGRLFTGPASVWQFVPQVSQPIFNGGRIRSELELATAQEQLLLLQYERTIQTAFREVSDALIRYQKVREVRGTQEQLRTTLEDRSRLSYVRYRGGVDTLLNALDADRDLFDAELRLAQTKRNELLALVQLYKALGGGWQQ
jgi:outer membrane protein, multidrug efflux system